MSATRRLFVLGTHSNYYLTLEYMMTKEFTPYRELDEDLGALSRCDMVWDDHKVVGCAHKEHREALRRLLAAFKEPECGAEARNARRGPVGWWDSGKVEWVVCGEPRGHDGPHVPAVTIDSWIMPDA